MARCRCSSPLPSSKEAPSRSESAAEQAVGQLETQIAELQGLITELRPAALDDIGLEPALRSLFERTLEAHGVTVAPDIDLDLEAGRSASRLEPEIEGTVYRLVQEALSNTAKHASTDRASVRVIEQDGHVSIEVRDEGRGFDPTDPRRGFGLLGMRERVELTGGTLEIDSLPGAGTRVYRDATRAASCGASAPAEPRLRARPSVA